MSINQNTLPTREPLYTMADALISFSRAYADLSIMQIRRQSQPPQPAPQNNQSNQNYSESD
ncbi:MAG: hypothetical protein ACRCT1_10115 [Microcoleaceae cyanobacterium]|jgi:hypothetical protein